MRGKLALSAAWAALLLCVPTAMAQSVDQPGDNTTQVRLSGSAVGAFETAGDVDWYRLSVQAGQRYALTLDGVAREGGEAVDPMLAIYDASGNQVAMNDDANESLNSALSYTPSASGEVFVEARAFSNEATGAYRLAVSSAPVPPDDAGNDATTRARIQGGRSVTGSIETEGDADWYRFSARGGQTYTITLAGTPENGVGDTVLRIVDREGNELAANDDSEGTLNSSLQFAPERGGDVFVIASAFADAYTGNYTLSINGAQGPRDNLAASSSTRGSLRAGQSIDESLSYAGDKDWYRIRLQEGQSYRFTLTSNGDTPLGDPLLRLYGPRGEDLAGDDDGGQGLNSYLEFTAPSTGTYFVEARGFGEDATGGYTIAAQAGDIPGDASTDASLSADGDYYEGNLSPAGDHDWFNIDLAQGQGIRAAMVGGEGGEVLNDPMLVLYGPDGAPVLTDDDGGEGLNAWFEFIAPAAGRYHLEARGFTDDATGRYTISIMPGDIGNSAEGAEYLTANGEGRVGTINSNDDADWFAIELIEGRPYRFYADGIADGAGGGLADPYITLYDSEGNQISADDDGGAGLNSYLTYASIAGGTYYAAVSSFNSTGSGRYSLRVVDTDVPGNVNTDEMLDSNTDERLSRIDMPGDLDNYRVELEAGVRYTIEVSGEGDNPLADPFLAILDEQSARITSDDDSGPGLDARLDFTPENSGTFFLQASGLGGSTGWYQIRIVRQ